MNDKLTTKQRLFVEAFIATSNATEAARQAGYKGNDVTLGQVGAENLKKPQIAEAVKKRVEQAAMTTDEWMQEVTVIARTAEKTADRIAAYGLLGKPLNLTNTTNTNLNGTLEVESVIRPKLSNS